jgi:hypothetical protein
MQGLRRLPGFGPLSEIDRRYSAVVFNKVLQNRIHRNERMRAKNSV